MRKLNEPDRRQTVIRMLLVLLAGAALALLLIFPLRSVMNAVSRLDYVSQRLDDYPRMKAAWLQDTEARADWRQKEVYGRYPRQAAFIYDHDEKHAGDAEKLRYISVNRLIGLALDRIGKYLSPKEMTVCRLLDSGFMYVGTIVMIIYALSMFGVNTATLVGGVGATALIFTLGANSLIADVLAGIFIIFEGDFTVGDVVVIDGFRGIVTDIGMRTTKLMDDNTRDIRIINNSTIKTLTNQSRENSSVIIDISISRSVGLEKGEEILRNVIGKLPEMYLKIIGTPCYWGISKLPEKSPYTGKLGGFKARIAFDCREQDKEMLTYEVSRSLIDLVCDLNEAPPADPNAAAAAKEGADRKTNAGRE